MTPQRNRRILLTLLSFASLNAVAAVLGLIPNLTPFRDNTGAVATYNTAGAISEQNPFFQSLGTNGRTCATCHQADQAFGLSAAGARLVYARTHGTDPLFASFDGANCPTDTSTDPAAHSLLLNNGLIRIGITPPSSMQFTISVVHDPYGCAITYDPNTGAQIISLYRRPLPSTNLRFLTTVMFDGRETLKPLNSATTLDANLAYDLTDQATSAVLTHAQGTAAPTAQQLAQIVQFETGLSTAQTRDNIAGSLSSYSATGGPSTLSALNAAPGINDPLGGTPIGVNFNENAFSLYTAWENIPAPTHFPWVPLTPSQSSDEMKREIAAGEKIFNTQPVIITGVRGLNDNATLGSPSSITGTCTTCHNTPNVGNHSVALPLDIGTSRQAGYETNPAIIAALQQLSAPDLPIYEIRGCPDPQNPGSTVTFYTSDPGKGLITGLCSDVNRGKGPILRGLAARAPYFHNGAAANLQELVSFYNQRFQMNLSAEQQRDLIAFLNSL
jgi:cytochrome c peroxidase